MLNKTWNLMVMLIGMAAFCVICGVILTLTAKSHTKDRMPESWSPPAMPVESPTAPVEAGTEINWSGYRIVLLENKQRNVDGLRSPDIEIGYKADGTIVFRCRTDWK